MCIIRGFGISSVWGSGDLKVKVKVSEVRLVRVSLIGSNLRFKFNSL